MPIIEVRMLEGRSVDEKRSLARELTDGFVRACGGDPGAVRVVIHEVPRSSWAVGGVLFSDRND
jgi:4-oxalocrotonate tautomerase